MENFTPLTATIGGVLIGISAVLLMSLTGRIAGISGIFAGAAFANRGDRGWRWAFLVGLVAAPLIYALASGESPPFELNAGAPTIIAAGLLVGFGTRLGSGCTSGHGVCGLARLSPRSLVSVIVFMFAGMATVAVTNAAFGG